MSRKLFHHSQVAACPIHHYSRYLKNIFHILLPCFLFPFIKEHALISEN
jgi:hypothetical protein